MTAHVHTNTKCTQLKVFSIIKKKVQEKALLLLKYKQTKTPWHVKNVMADSSFWKAGDAEQLCFSASDRRSVGSVMAPHALEYSVTLQMAKASTCL